MKLNHALFTLDKWEQNTDSLLPCWKGSTQHVLTLFQISGEGIRAQWRTFVKRARTAFNPTESLGSTVRRRVAQEYSLWSGEPGCILVYHVLGKAT